MNTCVALSYPRYVLRCSVLPHNLLYFISRFLSNSWWQNEIEINDDGDWGRLFWIANQLIAKLDHERTRSLKFRTHTLVRYETIHMIFRLYRDYRKSIGLHSTTQLMTGSDPNRRRRVIKHRRHIIRSTSMMIRDGYDIIRYTNSSFLQILWRLKTLPTTAVSVAAAAVAAAW